MTLQELVGFLYAKMQDDPQLWQKQIRSIQLDIAAQLDNIEIQEDKWFIEISNWKLL